MPSVPALLALVGCLGAAGCAASPAPREAASPPSGAEEQNSGHHARQMNRALGWVSVAVGSEAAVVAVATSVRMLQVNGTRNEDCTNKVCSPAGLDANTQLGQLAPWNVGAWTIAAVGLFAGVYLLLTNPSDAALHTQVGVAPIGSGTGLSLRGSF
jgi:hypothetical protein